MDKLFLLVVKYREFIITVFKIIYVSLILVLLVGTWSVVIQNELRFTFLRNAIEFGKVAISLYIPTLIPGIARRFGIKHKAVSIIMIFRRYIGILSWMFVLMHFWFVRGIDWFLLGKFNWPIAVFELFGVSAGIGFLLLGVTSNDVSTNKMGVWWGRIHALTYIMVWLMFLHVMLQVTDIWAILLGLTGIVVVLSHLYSRYKTR